MSIDMLITEFTQPYKNKRASLSKHSSLQALQENFPKNNPHLIVDRMYE